jgi:SAM-dependent MidA family methyltransferase
MHNEISLTATEAARSAALLTEIKEEIHRAEGQLGFDRFMELALYLPELGYYASTAEKFGPEGDFITAPLLTPVFGVSVAAQVAELLAQQPEMRVLEYGAGTGQLAVVVLTELERLDCLPAGYDIVERSAGLRLRQQQLIREQIPALAERVNWLDESPRGYRGVVIANELLDAMPVKRLVNSSTGFREQVVGWNGDELVMADRPLGSPEVERRLAAFELPVGYQTEINCSAEAWVESLGEVLDEGLVLIVDYGYSRAEYYHPQRDQGTFLCYFRHRAADDPLRLPGLQDMTAHVDFTAMAEAADRSGLTVAGFTTQANFLISCGALEQLADRVADADYVDLLAPVKQLLLPGGMGEVFKVLALTKNYPLPLRGMATRDIRHTL